MAERVAASPLPTVPAKIKLTAWGSGETMYRVHDAIYTVDEFNPSRNGNAGFSPILDSSGNVISHSVRRDHTARRVDGERLSGHSLPCRPTKA